MDDRLNRGKCIILLALIFVVQIYASEDEHSTNTYSNVKHATDLLLWLEKMTISMLRVISMLLAALVVIPAGVIWWLSDKEISTHVPATSTTKDNSKSGPEKVSQKLDAQRKISTVHLGPDKMHIIYKTSCIICHTNTNKDVKFEQVDGETPCHIIHTRNNKVTVFTSSGRDKLSNLLPRSASDPTPLSHNLACNNAAKDLFQETIQNLDQAFDETDSRMPTLGVAMYDTDSSGNNTRSSTPLHDWALISHKQVDENVDSEENDPGPNRYSCIDDPPLKDQWSSDHPNTVVRQVSNELRNIADSFHTSHSQWFTEHMKAGYVVMYRVLVKTMTANFEVWLRFELRRRNLCDENDSVRKRIEDFSQTAHRVMFIYVWLRRFLNIDPILVEKCIRRYYGWKSRYVLS